MFVADYDNDMTNRNMKGQSSFGAVGRSAAVAPEPQPEPEQYDIEDQQKVLQSSASRGRRSRMSPLVPILVFLFLASAILLVVLLVVVKDKESRASGPTMAPTPKPFLPLEPTNNGNIEAAATTLFSPFGNTCSWGASVTQPNVLDQCACFGTVDFIASDVRARWTDLVENFIVPTVYPDWNEDISSCTPKNRALLWMSSGIFNGGEISNLLKLQRYSLALLYTEQQGMNWRSSSNWMSELDVCVWEGVECNGDSYVQFLDLSRNRLAGQVS
jgi:hypothetical protein